MTEGEMVGWHHQLYGHEFEQALGVGDGQGSLAFMLSILRYELLHTPQSLASAQVATLSARPEWNVHDPTTP